MTREEELREDIEMMSAENKRLLQFVDFVNLWCNRESKISDGSRLSAIKFHPTAQARLKLKR